MKDLPRHERQHVHKITIGRIPIGIARLFVDKEYRPILKQVKKLRILSIGDVDHLDSEIINGLYEKVDHRNYQELVEIRNKGERVFLKMKEDENKDTLNELIAVINDGSALSIIEVKGKISYSELEKIIQTLNESDFALTSN